MVGLLLLAGEDVAVGPLGPRHPAQGGSPWPSPGRPTPGRDGPLSRNSSGRPPLRPAFLHTSRADPL